MKVLTLALLGLFLVNMATTASATSIQCPTTDAAWNEMILDDGPSFLTTGQASLCLRQAINEERGRISSEGGQQPSDSDIVVMLQQGAALATYGQLQEDVE